MRLGHYQLQCTPRDFAANSARVLSGLETADAKHLDIISFPESFLTGFFSAREDAMAHSLSVGDARFNNFLKRTAKFRAMFMVGFNELRGDHLFNSVLVAQHGQLLGIYSKAFPEPYFTPGRDFPLFECNGIPFGVIICADGGYVEPARILALKGARIIFAPHYNYIAKGHLIDHFQRVRNDHIARATENNIWFLRGNNVVNGNDAGVDYEGVGYGDSYLLDPNGEMIVRAPRGVEHLLCAEIEVKPATDDRSKRSAVALGHEVLKVCEALKENN